MLERDDRVTTLHVAGPRHSLPHGIENYWAVPGKLPGAAVSRSAPCSIHFLAWPLAFPQGCPLSADRLRGQNRRFAGGLCR